MNSKIVKCSNKYIYCIFNVHQLHMLLNYGNQDLEFNRINKSRKQGMNKKSLLKK